MSEIEDSFPEAANMNHRSFDVCDFLTPGLHCISDIRKA